MLKYQIELDKDNYVSGIICSNNNEYPYTEDFIYNTFYKDGKRINCYHLINGKFVWDEKKEQEEIAKEKEEAKKPTELEKLDAQIMYTALMTSTMLESEEE